MYVNPEDLSDEEIEILEDRFDAAIKIALELGFDGLDDCVIGLQAENARLLAANEQAADELAEALYNLRLMTTQADANYKRAKDAEEQLRKYQIVTVARRCSDSDRDCDGDGSGPGCENAVVWEIQAMDDSGSHYAYVCAEHLSDYQKWAHDDGRLPMVFELADEE